MSETTDMLYDYLDKDDEPANPVCRSCGEECTWHHTGERWALLGGDGRLHNCRASASVDEFEDLNKGDTNG